VLFRIILRDPYHMGALPVHLCSLVELGKTTELFYCSHQVHNIKQRRRQITMTTSNNNNNHKEQHRVAYSIIGLFHVCLFCGFLSPSLLMHALTRPSLGLVLVVITSSSANTMLPDSSIINRQRWSLCSWQDGLGTACRIRHKMNQTRHCLHTEQHHGCSQGKHAKPNIVSDASFVFSVCFVLCCSSLFIFSVLFVNI